MMGGTYIKDDSTKGGQVTKPIIVVKMPCKLLYTYVASDWPRTFFTASLFLFSISLFFVSIQKQII